MMRENILVMTLLFNIYLRFIVVVIAISLVNSALIALFLIGCKFFLCRPLYFYVITLRPDDG